MQHYVVLIRGRYVLLQLGLATVAITLGSFPIFVRCPLLAFVLQSGFWSDRSLRAGRCEKHASCTSIELHLQVPNASQLQLAGVSSFWSPLSLVMGPRNWFWISLGAATMQRHARAC